MCNDNTGAISHLVLRSPFWCWWATFTVGLSVKRFPFEELLVWKSNAFLIRHITDVPLTACVILWCPAMPAARLSLSLPGGQCHWTHWKTNHSPFTHTLSVPCNHPSHAPLLQQTHFSGRSLCPAMCICTTAEQHFKIILNAAGNTKCYSCMTRQDIPVDLFL